MLEYDDILAVVGVDLGPTLFTTVASILSYFTIPFVQINPITVSRYNVNTFNLFPNRQDITQMLWQILNKYDGMPTILFYYDDVDLALWDDNISSKAANSNAYERPVMVKLNRKHEEETLLKALLTWKGKVGVIIHLEFFNTNTVCDFLRVCNKAGILHYDTHVILSLLVMRKKRSENNFYRCTFI